MVLINISPTKYTILISLTLLTNVCSILLVFTEYLMEMLVLSTFETLPIFHFPEQEKVRECNLVNNPVCNGIHGDEVISMQCKEVPKGKVRMNLHSSVNRFPRKRLGWTYQNISKMVNQDVPKGKSCNKPRKDWHDVLMCLYKNATLSMFLYATLYTMNPARMLQKDL